MASVTTIAGALVRMGRGKIEIKRIENSTNRQVTYSKRRAGILKKAQELTVLCDAQVSLIMFSSTGKFSEYCSPSTTTKSIFDRYQHVSGVNLWSSHYQKMKNHLNKLKEENNRLRKHIRHKKGEDLDDLSFNELRSLEQNIGEYLKAVTEKKIRKIVTQTDTCKKKVRSSLEQHKFLLRALEALDPHRGFDRDGIDCESALGLGNEGSHHFAFHMEPNLRDETGYSSHDLRLG